LTFSRRVIVKVGSLIVKLINPINQLIQKIYQEDLIQRYMFLVSTEVSLCDKPDMLTNS